jgi:hypothetical protein
MDFQEHPPQHLLETPPALIEKAEIVDPSDELVQKFFDSAARAFEEGQLAGLSEAQIIELTAVLVTRILIAQGL